MRDVPGLVDVDTNLNTGKPEMSVRVDRPKAADLGVQVCEIHTGPYAAAFAAQGRQADAPAVAKEITRIAKAGEKIISLGMQFNAGHALNYANVQPIAALPGARELHIGHAIVSRAVIVGMREAVREMKRLMREAQAAEGHS